MRKFIYLSIIFLGLFALMSVYLYERRWLYFVGLPLDDSYIHLQYARNIVSGEWFVYNIGDKATAGDTSPLWVLLLAGLGLIYKNLIIGSILLCGIFYILTGIMAFYLGEKFFESKWFALGFAVVVIFTGRMLWAGASGMEITLFSFLCLSGALSYFRDKAKGKISLITGIIFGLASNARPEGNLLFLLLLFDWIFLEKIMKERRFRFSFIPWRFLIAYFVLVIPYPLFCFLSSGNFTPNAYNATRLPFSWSRSFEYLRLVLEFFYHDHLLVHLALPIGASVFLLRLIKGNEKERRNFLLWLFPLGYLIASFFITPIKYHFQRYLIPFLPFYIFLSFYGWDWVSGIIKMRAGEKVEKWASLFLMTAFSLYAIILTIYSWPFITTQCVKNIDEMQVKIGEWIKNNTEPDALIAANDIGAIFYTSRRRALDLVGLINPEILSQVQGLKIPSEKRDEVTLKHLLEKKPDYLIIFPNWFPKVIENENYFRRVFSARLDDNIICAGNEMVVYKCFWE